LERKRADCAGFDATPDDVIELFYGDGTVDPQ